MTAAIVGWAHSRFSKLDGEDTESLIVETAAAALEDAGLAPVEIDEIFVGNFNGGFVRQEFPSSLALQLDPSLRFKPATHVENACATGSAAIHQGQNAIAAGRAKHVLVVCVERITALDGPAVGGILTRAAYLKEEGDIEGGFTGVFGRIAHAYFQRYGDKSDALAHIAAKNHKNGVANPLAQIRQDLGYDFCRTVSDKNPLVADPLRHTDCSPVSDGAAALVLIDVDTVLAAKKAVVFRAAEQVNDFLPMSKRDLTAYEGAALAWKRAFEHAGVGLWDPSCTEVHDCFTIAEWLIYESTGMAKKGEGEQVVAEGITEHTGRLPINASGGLKAKGHPIGAIGVSMHVLQSMQLTGTAGDIQVPGVRLAGMFNISGASVANYVSILERLR
jgi:acetyl-CoA C-acetyltransferase